jgi:membrane protease YdiL (CAAX protease family)
MLTTQLELWFRVTLYLLVVGIALEMAHRAYFAASRWASKLPISCGYRAALMALATCIPLLAACAVTGAFCVYVDRESLASIGIRLDLQPGSNVAIGSMIAFAGVTLMFVVGILSGWFHIQSSPISSDFQKGLPTFCGGFSDMIMGAIFEELVMRGYVFAILYRGAGPSVAVLGSSTLFSIFHLLKHTQLPPIFTVNAFLFGILMAHVRLATGAIWMPIGLHAGWNIASTIVFGLPFAGKPCNMGLMTCTVEGPSVITGGYYSPGAGLLGTLALAIVASAVVRMG